MTVAVLVSGGAALKFQTQKGCDMSQQPTDPQDGFGAEAQAAAAAAQLPGNYFEIYKIAVEMADRISARRGLANTFFLTINTTVLGVLGIHEASWSR